MIRLTLHTFTHMRSARVRRANVRLGEPVPASAHLMQKARELIELSDSFSDEEGERTARADVMELFDDSDDDEIVFVPAVAPVVAPASVACVVCTCDSDPRDIRLTCQGGHAVCGDCLPPCIEDRCALMRNSIAPSVDMGLACPLCDAVHSLGSVAAASPEGAVALAAAFAIYSKNAGRREAEAAARAAAEAEALLSAEEAEARVHVEALRSIFIDECPNPACGAAWIDFDGCCALTCGVCETGFCAHCDSIVTDPDELHAHVRLCWRNPFPGRLFTPMDVYQARKKEERGARYRAYAEDLDDRMKELVIPAIREYLHLIF